MPDVRAFMASGYFNGKIYLVGGYYTGNISPAFLQTWEYDPVANTFATKTSIPAANGFGGAASGVINGHLYVAGGRDATQHRDRHDVGLRHCGRHLDGASQSARRRQRAGLGGDWWQAVGIRRWQSLQRFGRNAFSRKEGLRVPDTTNALEIYDPVSDSWTSGPGSEPDALVPSGHACGRHSGSSRRIRRL